MEKNRRNFLFVSFSFQLSQLTDLFHGRMLNFILFYYILSYQLYSKNRCIRLSNKTWLIRTYMYVWNRVYIACPFFSLSLDFSLLTENKVKYHPVFWYVGIQLTKGLLVEKLKYTCELLTINKRSGILEIHKSCTRNN